MGSIKVGSLLGIPLRVNPSWLIIFASVTYFLIAAQFPARFPWWSPLTYVIAGVVTSLLFFGSVIVHELAHSMVARSLGIPVHSITLFIFGGVAQVARDPVHPAGELLMAAVGPLTSLGLAVFFAALGAGASTVHEPAMAMAGWLAGLNLSLAVFNMLPGFPMDGGRVFRSLVWWATGDQSTATNVALAAGRAVSLLFIVGGLALVVMDRSNLFNGLWIAFIGWFLGQAVRSSARQSRMRKSLAGYTARDLMSADLSAVPPQVTLRQVTDHYLGNQLRPWFLVVGDDRFLGLLGAAEFDRVPKARWDQVTAQQAMRPVAQIPVVPPGAVAMDILDEMDEHSAGHAAVVGEDQTLQGIVAQRAIFRTAGIRVAGLPQPR